MTAKHDLVPKLVVLAVLDGFGISLEDHGNAVAAAQKLTLDNLEANFPFLLLQASGSAVGLPWREPGNSEVGHLTMGAGRTIFHHLPRIITAIQDGTFFENPAFRKAIEHVRQNNSRLHLAGLVSSGSVHSYVDHLFALFEFAKREGLSPIFLHVITDGKDAPPDEGRSFIEKLQKRIERDYPFAAIASLIGRHFAMDRDGHWDRIQKTYELLVEGRGKAMSDAAGALAEYYQRGSSDETIEPTYLADSTGEPVGRLRAGDAIIFFNFREDSMRELCSSLAQENFSEFKRTLPTNLKIVSMTQYAKNLDNVEVAFSPIEITNTLAEVIAKAGKKQLHIAESEKYAHVTYFFNGLAEKPFAGEDRLLVPSVAVPHFDEHPEMKSREITEKIMAKLGEYDFILVNFANADMVGHTGNFEAAVKAVQALDEALAKLVPAVLDRGGTLVITGDHGNVEEKIHRLSGEAVTEHTINPVPFYLVAESFKKKNPRNPEEILALKQETSGIITDIAPTILELMRIPKPAEMTGKSLLNILT